MAAKTHVFAAVFLLALIFAFTSRATPQSAVKSARRAARPKPTPGPPLALPDGIEPPAYQHGQFPFHAGEKLVYQASWIGIPAATARVELHKNQKDPSMLKAEIWVETNQAVDLLYRMRDYLSEQMREDSLAPQKMYIRQSENKRLNDFNVTFDHQTGLVTLVKSNRRGKLVRRFLSTNPWGPLSAAMMAMSLPLSPGDHYSIDVFTGTTRYVFDFRVAPREKITTALGTFDAFRLVPGVLYQSDGKLSQSATGTTIWVSADARHLPLRAEAQAFIGKIRADLVEVDG